ncbi:Uncharacterised protein [Salmonella enterica subsp. arizonae]|uniref:Uncharacterized protein n=1 Tax=Salmonella enterica subsp. arizonae TaxID=59203 RepID=A0A379TID1_SALER|nr:Uncharacterised protein [Salmonella enterica subsp. arizonae]
MEPMKYELTNITQYYNGVALRRIRALRDSELSGFKRGDIGGWIQTTDNLSQEGECWIHHDARVLGKCPSYWRLPYFRLRRNKWKCQSFWL